MSLYDELCLGQGASQDQIKDNYRKLAKQYHPDVAGSDFDREKWGKILHAYEVLSAPDRRREYDSTGNEGLGNQQSLEDKAIRVLVEGVDLAANTVIHGGDHNIDFVAGLRKYISDRHQNTSDDISKMKEALKQLWLFRAKFTKTGGRTSVLIGVVKEKIINIRAQKAAAEEMVSVLDKAEELLILIEFDYTPEEIDDFLAVGSMSASAGMFATFTVGG